MVEDIKKLKKLEYANYKKLSIRKKIVIFL